MLHPVGGHPGLRAAHTYERTLRNIIIHAVDIWVSVMNNVVFELPDKTVTTQCIQCKAKQVVHPLAG